MQLSVGKSAYKIKKCCLYAPLAQMVERCPYMANVASSSLAGSTNIKLGFLVVTV